MGKFGLAETLKIVEAIEPQAGAGITGDYVSLRTINMVWIVVHIDQVAVNTVAITIEKATHVAPTGSTAITENAEIWVNQDCVTSSLLVRQPDAVSFTSSTAQKHKVFVFRVDPAGLGIRAASGLAYDCITVITGASDATNITSAMYYLETKYAADQSLEVITD